MTKNVMTVLMTFILAALLASSVSFAQTTTTPSAALTAGPRDQQPAAKPEPTLLSVADEYVKIVGGVITVLATVLGFPLVYQTFRKTRAEIAKIDLEATKLRKELETAGTTGLVGGQEGYQIYVDGAHNSVSVLTDPRWAAPLLVLVDAFIAFVFSAVASFAIGFLPFPYLLKEPIRLIVYLIIFYPVFQAARRVKKSLGEDFRLKQDQSPPAPEAST